MTTALATDNNSIASIQRLAWCDIAKGFALLHVVVAHVLGGLSDANAVSPPLAHWYGQYAYLFMMPCFFFLSGLFIEGALSKGVSYVAVSRARTILWPFLVWTAILYFAFMAMSRFSNGGRPASLLPLLTYAPGWHLWFLYALLLNTAVYVFARRIMPAWALATVAACVSVALISGSVAIPWRIANESFPYLLFFAAGGALGPDRIDRWLRQPPIIRFSIVLIGSLLLLVAARLELRGTVGGYVAGAVGTVWTLVISRTVASSVVGDSIGFIGVRSLEIYVAHTLFTAGSRVVGLRIGFADDPVVLVVIGVLAGVVGPLLLSIAAKRAGFRWLFRWRGFLSTSTRPVPLSSATS